MELEIINSMNLIHAKILETMKAYDGMFYKELFDYHFVENVQFFHGSYDLSRKKLLGGIGSIINKSNATSSYMKIRWTISSCHIRDNKFF